MESSKACIYPPLFLTIVIIFHERSEDVSDDLFLFAGIVKIRELLYIYLFEKNIRFRVWAVQLRPPPFKERLHKPRGVIPEMILGRGTRIFHGDGPADSVTPQRRRTGLKLFLTVMIMPEFRAIFYSILSVGRWWDSTSRRVYTSLTRREPCLILQPWYYSIFTNFCYSKLLSAPQLVFSFFAPT